MSDLTSARSVRITRAVWLVFRSRLWDIDRIISRALVYTVLSVTIAAIYIGSVVGMQLKDVTGWGAVRCDPPYT
jgi:hypothetical protein